MPARKKRENKDRPDHDAGTNTRRSSGPSRSGKQPAPDESNLTLQAKLKQLEQQNEELRKSQIYLVESREKYRLIMENTAVHITVMDLNLTITYVSPSIAKLRGYTAEEAITQTLDQILLPASLKKIKKVFDEQMALEAEGAADPQRIILIELEEYCKDGSTIWVEDVFSFIRDYNHKPIGILSVTRDITERKRLERDIKKSESRFRGYFDMPLHGIAITSPDKGWLQVNDRLCTMLGYTRDEILRMTWPEMTHPDDLAADVEQFNRVMSGEIEQYTVNKRFIRKNGQVVWTSLAVGCVREPDGRVDYMIALLDDITERKRSEEALQKKNDELVQVTTQLEKILQNQDRARQVLLSILEDERIARQVLLESEEKYRTLYETMAQGVVYQSADGTIISANPAAERILGIPIEHMKGHTTMDPMWRTICENGSDCPGEDHPSMAALRTGKEVRGVVMGVFNPLFKDYRWISINAIPQFMKGGDRPYQVYTTFTDITDLKNAEQLARYQLQFLYVVINAIKAPIFFKDAEGRYSGCNTAFEEYVGVPLSGLVGKTVFDLWPRELAEVYRQKDQELFKTGGDQTYEAQVRFADGTYRDVLYHKSLFYDKNGKVGGMVGVMIDITDRKQTEEALRISEEKYRTLVENLNDVIYMLDPDGIVTYISSGSMRLFHYTPEEITGRHFRDFVYPDDYQAVQDQFLKTVAGADTSLEYRVVDKKNTIHYIRTSVHPVIINGHVAALNGILIDTTERRRAEEALRESEERLRITLDATQIGIWDWDLRNDRWYASSIYYTMLGYEPEQGPADRAAWLRRVHPDDRPLVEDRISDVLKKNSSGYQYEARLKHADGSYRWIGVLGYVAERDATGNATRMLGIRMDITERKRADEAVRESERFALSTVNALEASIAILDGSGEIISVNSSWRKLAFEKMENPIDVFEGINYLAVCDAARGINSEGAAEFAAGIRAVIQGEVDSFSQEYPCHSPADKRWYIGKVNRFPGRGELRLVVSHTDITELKLAEEKISASLREKEVLLREIHHRVKNNMQVISSLIGLQSAYITKGADIKNALSEMQNRIKSMAIVHEKLYQSADLSNIDFKEYLTSLTASVVQSFMINPDRIRLELNIAPVMLGIDMAVPSGLILNELITNAFKYAFPGGRRGVITITIAMTDDGLCRISVRDDGVGLPDGFDINEPASLGLRLVRILTQQLEGELMVRNEGGAEFAVVFPVRKEGRRNEGK